MRPIKHVIKSGGWITAFPLEKYSSFHELSLTSWLGWDRAWLKLPFYIQFDFNLDTPFTIDPKANLTLKIQDATIPPASSNRCFSVQTTRWRVDISSYSSFNEFLNSLIRWHHCNYLKSQKVFQNYGSTVMFIEDDWTEYVDDVYKLYTNVSKVHGDQLYDVCFFQKLAKQNDSKLLCAMFKGEMIGMFVLQEEDAILHSICCGMDYDISSKCYAYSWLHYELIRLAIEKKKYHVVDVGLTADQSKKEIGFTAIPSRMDAYAKNMLIRYFLKGVQTLVTAEITSDAKLKFKFRT